MPDPVEEALKFVRAQRSKEAYRAVISYFLRWSGLEARDFVERASSQPKWAESLLVSYIQSLEKRKLSGSTVALYLVGLKALLEYNDVAGINWKKVKKAMPPARSYGTDRSPAVEEIRRILQFCDVRSRAVDNYSHSTRVYKSILKLSFIEMTEDNVLIMTTLYHLDRALWQTKTRR